MLKFKTDHLEEWRLKEIEEGGYWILPSHRKPYVSRREADPIRYWLVTITLTSGEIVEFYVKARTQFDAYEKADEYAEFAEVYKGKFVYLP